MWPSSPTRERMSRCDARTGSQVKGLPSPTIRSNGTKETRRDTASSSSALADRFIATYRPAASEWALRSQPANKSQQQRNRRNIHKAFRMPWHTFICVVLVHSSRETRFAAVVLRRQLRPHHSAFECGKTAQQGCRKMRLLQYRVLVVSAAMLALAAATGRLAQVPAVQVAQYCDPRQHDAPDAPRFYCLDADVPAVGERSAILS
jgi:hypothetical protein